MHTKLNSNCQTSQCRSWSVWTQFLELNWLFLASAVFEKKKSALLNGNMRLPLQTAMLKADAVSGQRRAHMPEHARPASLATKTKTGEVQVTTHTQAKCEVSLRTPLIHSTQQIIVCYYFRAQNLTYLALRDMQWKMAAAPYQWYSMMSTHWPPEREVTPTEVNSRSGRRVCVMYACSWAGKLSILAWLRNVSKGLMSRTFLFWQAHLQSVSCRQMVILNSSIGWTLIGLDF